MRILPLIAAFCVATTLAGCATDRGAITIGAPDVNNEADVFGDYLAARFAADHHDLNEAAKYYRAGLDSDPKNPQLLAFSFFYAASSGEVDQAAELAKRLAVTSPDDRASRLTLAVAALKHRDYKEARAQIAKSANGPFTTFTVALIDAWAAAGMGDGKAAEADLKKLHVQSAADALAYFNEAMLAEYLGQKDTADTDYQKELETAGPSPRVIDAYGRFLERNGRAKEAKALYAKVEDEGALAPIAKAGLARIAAGTIPQPLVVHPEDGAAEALFGIAASLNDESSRDISILYLRLALYLQPNLDLANLLLADRFDSLQKYDDAIAVYKSIGRDSAYYRLAAVEITVDLSRLGKTDEAIKALQELTALYPSDVETWTALGDAYRLASKFPEATKAYSNAIDAAAPPAKKNWPLYYARAIAEQQSNDWKAAEADLKEALQLSPDEPQVLNYLGYSWVDQRRHIPEALAMLEKARSLAPQDGYVIDSVGWAYFRLGRYADAAKALEDAILLVPGDPTINDHLGDAYWMVGKKLEARFQWNHALAFGAEGDEKTKIEKKLQVGLNREDRS
ncbi:MAG: tetratricopeptide repeat protein [Alphaproteobacteria bacterium]|nr:tetratricopeptide repeat protein [Alphaproteobacteria bacterium]MDE2162004.1 tetratricopeptide repeat protein [Alphaproteobacteria bacterium]MDE2265422.1 tetratricopeptide repeat protein [Alphaproteobacteria bacterium]MDE2499047.1 tetratricopeptide repeat protein [Alphaproteobacteria bacterium]